MVRSVNLLLKRTALMGYPSDGASLDHGYNLGDAHSSVGFSMKTIDTLVADIYKTLDEGVASEDFADYGEEHAAILKQRLAPRGEEREPRLRLSSIGKPCVRQLWYERYDPSHREPLRPFTRVKFLYGDLVETMLLELARRSGHLVCGEQDTLVVNEVEGHRDCVIDGMLVDVKSASSFSFKKFTAGLQRDEDAFGYLTQLGSYLLASADDPLVTYKNEAAFLVVDKVTGHLCLDRHTFTEEDFVTLSRKIRAAKKILARPGTVPARAFDGVPEGKSGNEKLGVNCSYCPFKAYCWPKLRTFMYAGGRPVFLTRVEKLPKVPEVINE